MLYVAHDYLKGEQMRKNARFRQWTPLGKERRKWDLGGVHRSTDCNWHVLFLWLGGRCLVFVKIFYLLGCLEYFIIFQVVRFHKSIRRETETLELPVEKLLQLGDSDVQWATRMNYSPAPAKIHGRLSLCFSFGFENIPTLWILTKRQSPARKTRVASPGFILQIEYIFDLRRT